SVDGVAAPWKATVSPGGENCGETGVASPLAPQVVACSAGPVAGAEMPVAARPLLPTRRHVAVARMHAHPAAAHPYVAMQARAPRPVAGRPGVAATRRRRPLETRRRRSHADAHAHADR